MENLELNQPIDKKTYLWSTIAGIIGFILINFFVISKIRYVDLGLFTEGIPISIFLHFLIGIIVGLISKTRIATKALINAGVLLILMLLSPSLKLYGILVFFGIFSYLLGSFLASIFYKFSKKWKIIIGSVFLTVITLLISIVLPQIDVNASVRMEITPKKDSYKLGETITVTTTLANHSLLPFNTEFYSVVPEILVYQIKPDVWFNYDTSGPFQYPDHFEEPEKLYLMPFQSKIYETKLTLINNDASFDYSGTPYDHDIVVQPGENTIQSFVSTGDDGKINVDSQSFNQATIPCENFIIKKEDKHARKKLEQSNM